jgi:hypothetical protein
MIKYPKINSVYLRHEKTKKFVLGQYSCDEFAYLANNEWIGEEKIDGMNVVIWPDHEAKQLIIMGRNLQPTVPQTLIDRINHLLTYERISNLFQAKDETPMPVILYGEGCGCKIQKEGHIYVSGAVAQDFILFDIKVGHTWLRRHDIVSIANELAIRPSIEVFEGTLPEAVQLAQEGPKSAYSDDFQAEGLVLRPKITMLDRRGCRVITKVKAKDF